MQYSIWGGGNGWWDIFYSPFSVNTSICILFGIWGQVAVVVFVVISAYYQCDSVGIKYTKVFYLVRETIFLTGIAYGAVIIKQGILFGGNKAWVKLFVKIILSPVNNTYWFITAYILYFLSIPALQMIVSKSNKKELKTLCITLCGAVFCLDFLKYRIGGAVIDFACVFLVTAYCKKYMEEIWKEHAGKVFAACAAGMILLNILLNVLHSVLGYKVFITGMLHFFVGWNPFIIICSISLFWLFKERVWKSKMLCSLGKTSLGVYILSENPAIGGADSVLWCKWFDLQGMFDGSDFFAGYLIVAVLLVWIVCVMIDYVWIEIERLILARWDSKFAEFFYKVRNKYFN